MKDKVQKIREEVVRLKSLIGNNSFLSDYEKGCNDGREDMCDELISIIDSLQEEPVSKEIGDYDHKAVMEALHTELKEEPVSEDLGEYINELSKQFPEVSFAKLSRIAVRVAQWQKANLWKPADEDDLPEYDREVIAILDYDFGHYKVVYAHRPNPEGWNGTNIDTGEKEHFEPATYGKGGWNQPHVLYWLDAMMPYEEK